MPELTPESRASSGGTESKPKIIVTDLEMTIGAMCRFMIKLVIASIPALIILIILCPILYLLFVFVFAAITR